MRYGAVLALGAVMVLGGCSGSGASPDAPVAAPSAVDAYLSDKPEETHGMFRRVVAEGERNRVLNLLRSGLAAMQLGHDAVAVRAFDDALLTIETMYGGDETAARARSTFAAEDRKTFRGEPYERAMAFYYRGILYLMEGDYENARASFRSGILQDTLAEQEEYRQDFALLEFLEGWSSQCNGDAGLAAEAYALAHGHNAALVLPAADHNLLVLADLGHAPVKFAAGEYGELLRIRKNRTDYVPVDAFELDGTAAALGNAESVLWQAQTRGGRQFDAILEGKAQFKAGAEEVAETAGTVAEVGVAVGTTGLLTGDEDMANVGGVMTAAGGLVSIVAGATAGATRPEADTRQWDNLPEVVAFGTYRAGGAAAVGGLPGNIRKGGDGVCQVAWTRFPETGSSNVGLQVSGKVFSGEIAAPGKRTSGYEVEFHPHGGASVTHNPGNPSVLCLAECSVSFDGAWTEEGDMIKLRYGTAMRGGFKTLWLAMNGGVLEGSGTNHDVIGGSKLRLSVAMREGAAQR